MYLLDDEPSSDLTLSRPGGTQILTTRVLLRTLGLVICDMTAKSDLPHVEGDAVVKE